MRARNRFLLATCAASLVMILILIAVNEVRIKRYYAIMTAIVNNASTLDHRFIKSVPIKVSARKLSELAGERANVLSELKTRLNLYWCPPGLQDVNRDLNSALSAHRSVYECLSSCVLESPENADEITYIIEEANSGYKSVLARMNRTEFEVVSIPAKVVDGVVTLSSKWYAIRTWHDETAQFLEGLESIINQYNVMRQMTKDLVDSLNNGEVTDEIVSGLSDQIAARRNLADELYTNVSTPDRLAHIRDQMSDILGMSIRVCEIYEAYARAKQNYEENTSFFYGPPPPDPEYLAIARVSSAEITRRLESIERSRKMLRKAVARDPDSVTFRRPW